MKRSLLVAGVALAGAFVGSAAQAAPSLAYVYIIGATAAGVPAQNTATGNYDSWRSAGPSANITGFSLVPTSQTTIPTPSSPVPLAIGRDAFAMSSAAFAPTTADPSYAVDIYFSENGAVDTANPLEAYIGPTGRVAEPTTVSLSSPLYGASPSNGTLTYNDTVDNETIALGSYSWATQTVSGQQQQIGGLSFDVAANAVVPAVAEPASYLVLAAGLVGLGGCLRRTRPRAAV